MNTHHNDEILHLLETGQRFFSCDEVPSPDTVEGMRRIAEIWKKTGEQITQNWIAKRPGTRPWAWWKFDAIELLRCLDGEHPFENEEYIAEAQRIRYCQEITSSKTLLLPMHDAWPLRRSFKQST